MDLNEIAVFTRVVQAGSFTAAAKALGMPKSTVSRKISDLEDRLNARLLQRTTRKLSLTDAGRTYFDYGVRIVNEIEAAESAVASLQDKPRGLLVATAGYLKKRRRPRTPDDLKDHDCLFFGAGSMMVNLRLESGDQSVQVVVPAHLLVSDMDIVYSAAT